MPRSGKLLHELTFSKLASLPQEQTETHHSQPATRAVEEWMLVCQCNAELQPNIELEQEVVFQLPYVAVQWCRLGVAFLGFVEGQHWW